MSEEKRTKLAETLALLNVEDKTWAINFLVQLLAGQTAANKRKVLRRHSDVFTEKQWEEYFDGVPEREFPLEMQSPKEFLRDSSGKTITPLKKWL